MMKQLYFFGNLLLLRFVYQLYHPFKYQFYVHTSILLDTMQYFASFPLLVVLCLSDVDKQHMAADKQGMKHLR